MDYTRHFNSRETDQGTQIPGEKMVKNNAGGFAFEVDMWTQLERFLILGSEGGTYYASERALTIENAENLVDAIKADGLRVVKTVVEISRSGRAPKNDAALFALAMASGLGDEETRRAAFEVLPQVARIGTHILQFASFMEGFRGWGRSARRGVGDWFLDQTPENLGYQFLKYAQRDGWSMRDLLRLTHPETTDEVQNAVFRYITRKELSEFLPNQLQIAHALDENCSVEAVVRAIKDHRLPREAVPTQHLNDVRVWEALLPHMPMTAMIRNLGKMSAVGLLKPLSQASKQVCEMLGSTEALQKAKVHPINVLSALQVYEMGHGMKGKLSWAPVPQVVDALNDAFYESFKVAEPTGKNILIGLDVSGSMTSNRVNGMDHMTARTAAAAMSMAVARVEKNWHVMAFTGQFVNLPISPKQRLADVVKATGGLPFGPTDCSVPMIWALQNKVEVDAFVIYTDNETWYGDIHPVQALRKYRETMGIPAKMITCALTATKFSIGKPSGYGRIHSNDPVSVSDPKDGGMLDVAGLDSAGPTIITDFIR